MTIDVKRGRELEKAATPGEWHATHYEGIGYRVWKEHPSPTPGYATVTITDGQWNEADGDLIVWLRNNCTALLDAAERVEAIDAAIPHADSPAFNALIATDVARDAAVQRAEAAERRVAEYSHMADAAERARDEALKEAHALRDLQAIVNRDGGHGSLADAIARVYAERAETDALRAQLAEALRRAEAARAILNKWCLPSLCVAGCKCSACRIRATLDPKGVK